MRGYCKGCFFWKEGKVEGGTNCIAPKSHKDIYHPFRDVDCYVEKGMILVEEEVSNGTAFGEIEGIQGIQELENAKEGRG